MFKGGYHCVVCNSEKLGITAQSGKALLLTASASDSKEPISCMHTVEDFQNYEGHYLT